MDINRVSPCGIDLAASEKIMPPGLGAIRPMFWSRRAVEFSLVSARILLASTKGQRKKVTP